MVRGLFFFFGKLFRAAEADAHAGEEGAALPGFLHRFLVRQGEVLTINEGDIVSGEDAEAVELDAGADGAAHVEMHIHLVGHILVVCQRGKAHIEDGASKDQHVGAMAQGNLEVQVERDLEVDVGGGEIDGVRQGLLGRCEAEIGTGGEAHPSEQRRIERDTDHTTVQVIHVVEQSVGGVLLVVEGVALMDIGGIDAELCMGIACQRQGHYQTSQGKDFFHIS